MNFDKLLTVFTVLAIISCIACGIITVWILKGGMA